MPFWHRYSRGARGIDAPSTAISADGPGNLYEAVEVAASPQARRAGCAGVLNDTIHGARRVRRATRTTVQPFSPNGGPVGSVDTLQRPVHDADGRRPRRTYNLSQTAPLPRVDIIYAHANMDATLIEDAVKSGARGLVLAGVGDGNGSQAAIDALAKAAQQGVVIVRASRVGSGSSTAMSRSTTTNSGSRSRSTLIRRRRACCVSCCLQTGLPIRAKSRTLSSRPGEAARRS